MAFAFGSLADPCSESRERHATSEFARGGVPIAHVRIVATGDDRLAVRWAGIGETRRTVRWANIGETRRTVRWAGAGTRPWRLLSPDRRRRIGSAPWCWLPSGRPCKALQAASASLVLQSHRFGHEQRAGDKVLMQLPEGVDKVQLAPQRCAEEGEREAHLEGWMDEIEGPDALVDIQGQGEQQSA